MLAKIANHPHLECARALIEGKGQNKEQQAQRMNKGAELLVQALEKHEAGPMDYVVRDLARRSSISDDPKFITAYTKALKFAAPDKSATVDDARTLLRELNDFDKNKNPMTMGGAHHPRHMPMAVPDQKAMDRLIKAARKSQLNGNNPGAHSQLNELPHPQNDAPAQKQAEPRADIPKQDNDWKSKNKKTDPRTQA